MNKNRTPLVMVKAPLFVGLLILLTVNLLLPPIVHATPGVLYAAPAELGSADCSSWGNACTLPAALSAAASGDEIWVKAGVHKPTNDPGDRTATFALKNGVAVYGGFAGAETSREPRDWQANPTILSGDIDSNDTNTDGNFIAETAADIQGSNAYHVVTGSYTNNTALLDGFVITAGQANGAAPHDSGGGMYNQDASPQLTHLIISGNHAADGGGMLNYNSHPLVTEVTFSGNQAASGGGMLNNHYSTPTLIRVTFDGNSATGSGGGMGNGGDHTDPVLQGVIFKNNTADQSGGGVHNGMYNSSGGTYTDVIFDGNSANEGGGMYTYNVSPVLTNVLFVGNGAAYGGGMYNYRSAMELIQATMIDNTATSQGGAMYNYWDRSPRLKNAILWGNSAPEGPQIYILAADTFVYYSDVQGCGGSGAGWNSACGTDYGGNIDADPQFVDAANGNLRLGLSSPAIDAGDNALVTSGVTTDLGGSPRFQDIPSVADSGSGTPPIVDMGAYEADITPPLVVSSLRADPSPTGAASVDFTVTFSEAVSGVAAADFSLASTGDVSGASVSGVSGGPTVYNVAVSTGTGDGTLRLDLPVTAMISDPSGNSLGGLPYTGGEMYTIEKTAPTVVSILRATQTPTNASSLDFQVTFSKEVTGVEVTDFSLAASGVSGASITGVSGGPLTYTVAVATGTGDGSLGVEVPLSATISDSSGNPLGGLPFTSGEAYVIDKTAPSVVSSLRADPNPTNAESVGFTVTFSEPVNLVAADDFILVTSGSLSGASVSGVSGGWVTYTVTAATGIGGGSLRLDVPAAATITDAAGNPLGGLPYQSGEEYSILYEVFLPVIVR